MGLFSSSTKYKAHAGSSALFEEDTREDTVKSLILQATIGGQSSLAEAVELGLQTNMYARAKSMYKYASRPDGYVYGFPETDGDILSVPNDAVKTAIESDIGGTVDSLAVVVGTPNEAFLIDREINSNYLNNTYFPWTNGDPLEPNWDESLTTIEIPVLDPTHDPAADPPTSPYYYADNDPNYIRLSQVNHVYNVTFDYTDSDSNPQVFTMASTVDITSYQGKELIQVRYEPTSAPGTTEYWVYEIGSGVNPTLEAAITRHQIELEYLPIAILMRDLIWFDEVGDPELELTTKRLLKRIALDPYDVKEQYIQSVQDAIDSGERPGEKKLDDWDFFIQFAVPIHSNIRGSREYLYHYFRMLEPAAPTFAEYQAFLSTGGTSGQPQFEMHITEGGDQGYNAYYRYSYIHSETKAGEYTPPGWVDPLRPRRMYSKVYQFGEPDYAEGIEEVHGVGTPIAVAEWNDTYHDYAVFTMQHADNTYTQVLVMAPSMIYKINTRVDGDYRYREVEVELFPEDPEEESEFKIPVHIGSLRETAVMRREEMLQDALCATVFLVEKIKVKWYQKSFFKWLIVIIVIVVVILAQQYQLLGTVAELATTALAAGATGTAIAFAALYVTLAFALGFMISFAGSLIGGDLGMLFMIVASIYMAGGFAGLGNSWTALLQAPGWGTATAFLQAVGPFMNAGMQIYQRYRLYELQEDMDAFYKNAKERQEELENAWDELGDRPSWLDPMDLVRIFSVDSYIESPEVFYARTLNANPGLMGYDFINHFTDLALMLPEEGGDNNFLEAMFQQFAEQRGQT